MADPTERGLPRGALVACALVALLIVVGVVLVNAPANWLARYVESRSAGHVVLADAQGTVWSGSAVLAFAGPSSGPASGPDPGGSAAGERLALPGRVIWTLETATGLAPVLHLTHDAVLLQPLALHYANGDIAIDAGAATLPVSLLRLAGSPFNTLQAEGRVTMRWDALRWTSNGALIGAGTATLADLEVAVSPVRPLGDYRIAWTGAADGVRWTVATDHGPLDLSGTGRVGRSPSVRVIARVAAGASPAVAARLAPLLDAIGRRSPTEAAFMLGGPT